MIHLTLAIIFDSEHPLYPTTFFPLGNSTRLQVWLLGPGLICSEFYLLLLLKIKPIMLKIMLSIWWLCLAKCCLIIVLCYFTDCSIRLSDCSIRVSRSDCCNACLTSKESMYSAALHVFSCNNLKIDVLRQSLWQVH